MNAREAIWPEHQRKRWMRPNAHLYMRPDASRWLRHDAHRFLPPQPYALANNLGQRRAAAADSTSEAEQQRAANASTLLALLDLKSAITKLRRDLAFERFQRAFLRWARADELRRKAGFRPDQPRVAAGNPDGGQWTNGGGGINDPRVLSDASPDPIRPGAQYAAKGHHWAARGVFEKEKYSFRPETLKVFQDATTGPLNDPTSNWYDEPHRQYNKAVEEAMDRFLERNKIRSDQMTPDQARSFISEIRTSSDPRIRQFIRRMIFREMQFWYRQGPRGRE